MLVLYNLKVLVTVQLLYCLNILSIVYHVAEDKNVAKDSSIA